MISRIEGQLVSVVGGRAQVRCDAVTYELLIPAVDQQRLVGMADRTINFFTLHYLEGQGQGSSFIPRLIGFATEDDRAFFELFTTVKGMGNRKALRAMTLPIGVIAEAIAKKDVDFLTSLPEVGKRTAETIVAELHGKVDRIVELKPGRTGGPDGVGSPRGGLVRDAVAMLTQLGEPNVHARQLVERALHDDPTIDAAGDLVAAAYRLKEA